MELEVQDKMPLLEWFANEYKCFGCTLELVTNKSQDRGPSFAEDSVGLKASFATSLTSDHLMSYLKMVKYMRILIKTVDAASRV